MAEQSPLFNHLVLAKICEYLPQKDLLSARAVCQFWHQEFSRKITIKFNHIYEVMEFCLFNNPTLKDEERRLDNNFTKFDFTGWDNLLNSPSLLEFDLVFKQLTQVATIRELTLPELPIKSYANILTNIKTTIQVLKVPITFYPDTNIVVNLEGIFPNNENIIILENIRKLILWSKPIAFENFVFNPRFLSNLLLSCILMNELDMSDFNMELSDILEWIPLKKDNYKFKNLKVIVLPYSSSAITEPEALGSINIITEGIATEIKYGPLSLTKENISDFFHILAIYNPDTLPELNKKARNYFQKQIHSIVKLSNNSSQIYKIPLKNLIFHFPSLKNFEFFEQDYKVTFNKKEADKILSLNNFGYQSKTRKIPLIGVAEKISEIFPNLTNLSLCANTQINFGPIFQNLTKLVEFKFFTLDNRLIGDEDLIGFSPKFLMNKWLPRKFDKNLFLEIKNDDDYRSKPSIAMLKDLKTLTIYAASNLNFGNGPRKQLTNFFFYFAFLLLPKLENLFLLIEDLPSIEKDHWNLFKEEFSSLQNLTLHNSLENKPVFSEIKQIRPQLSIKFKNFDKKINKHLI